jgi:hypothetical protein
LASQSTEAPVATRYATIQDWLVISGMRRSATYEALGRGDLRAVKMGKRTLIDWPRAPRVTAGRADHHRPQQTAEIETSRRGTIPSAGWSDSHVARPPARQRQALTEGKMPDLIETRGRARQALTQVADKGYHPNPPRDWSSRDGAAALAEIIAARSKELGAPLACSIVLAVRGKTPKGAARSIWGIRSRPAALVS